MNENNQIPYSRYDYYKYYNNYKEIYRINYIEKKRRNAVESSHAEYYKDYWLNARWKNVLIDKNKINTDNIDEATEDN